MNVLALNRMSDVGVVFGALKNYKDSTRIDWNLAWKAAIPVGIGAFVGANISVSLAEEVLKIVILGGVLVGVFFLLKPIYIRGGEVGKSNFLGWFFLFLVGAWSGALGMAGATFAVLVLVHFFHESFLQGRGTHVALAVPETIISVTVLALGSSLTWEPLVIMFVSSLVGAWFGSKLAVKRGSEFIRKAMIVIAVVMALKVVYDLVLSVG